MDESAKKYEDKKPEGTQCFPLVFVTISWLAEA